MVAEPGSYPRTGWTGLRLRRDWFWIWAFWLLTLTSAMDECVRLLEQALQHTMTELQSSQLRVTALESGAAGSQPPPPPSQPNTSLVDMRMLGKPAMFSGDRENWRG